MDDIADLRKMLQRLRVVDVKRRVFGSRQHQYRLGRVLSERKLASFESDNGIRLPEGYRRFLAVVGNGGAGPYYGLEPLSACGHDLSIPFPLTQATKQLSAADREALGEFLDRDEYPGMLELCHQGCAIYSYLVVNGPTYGTIWDGREDYYPTGLTFEEWYREWLERALRISENERLVSRLRVGMSRADVLSEVGGDWRELPAAGYPMPRLVAPDIPAVLELDERGLVVKVMPWRFI